MADINKSTSLPLPETKSSYLTGADGATTWIERMSRDLSREQPSITKTIIEKVITENVMHEVEWKVEAQVAAENPNRSAELLVDLLASANAKSIKETEQFPSARSSAYGWIYKSFGVTSLEVLMVDPDFKHNDRNARCPMVCFRRFIATHITERDGAGEELEVSNLNEALAKFANISQLPNESISDYHDRFLRFDKALNRQGIDSNGWLDTDKKRAIKFYQGMCESRHGQLKRDLANGSVATPNSISLLIILVRKRKEAPNKGEPSRKVAFVTTDSPVSHLVTPIVWYPKPTVEQRSMPDAERRMRLETNEALIKAFTMCMKAMGPGTSRCGWVSYEKYLAVRDRDPKEKIDDRRRRGRKDPDSKVLMIKNDDYSDEDIDERNRVLFSYHQACSEQPDISHHTCLTNTDTYYEEGETCENSTSAYQRELRAWEIAQRTASCSEQISGQHETPSRGVTDEVRVTKPTIHQASTDRATATEANKLGSGKYGYICDSASDPEHPPPLITVDSDSESDNDSTSWEHERSDNQVNKQQQHHNHIEWHDSDCRSAGETHNPEMIRRKPSLNHAHDVSSTEVEACEVMVAVDVIHEAIDDPTASKPIYWVMALGPNAGKIYTNHKEMNDKETTKGVAGAYRAYKHMAAARQASKIISTAIAAQTTGGGTELGDTTLQYDMSQHPQYNTKATKVPEHQLEVRDSKYRAVNGDGWVVPVGRGLTCTHVIMQGTEIAVFVGVPTDAETIASRPEEQQGYVIDMYQRDTHHSCAQQLIDCYPNSTGTRPKCLASMANDPIGLYNRLQDVTLEAEHANAAVVIGMRGNTLEAVLYATCMIKPGEEILWEYHSRTTDDRHPDSKEPQPIAQTDNRESGVNRGATHTTGSTSLHPTGTTNTTDSGVTSDITSDAGITSSEGETKSGSRNGEATSSPAHDGGGTTEGGTNASDDYDEGVTDCTSTTAVDTTEEQYEENYVTLDTAASTHVCRSLVHANDPSPCNPGSMLRSVSGGEVIEYVDDCVFISECLGRAAVVPKAARNIIALSKAREEGVHIDYHCTTDRFSLTTRKEEVFVFGRAVNEHGVSSYYTMDMATNRPPAMEPTDVRRIFTYVENGDADLAHSFIMSHVYANEPMRREPPGMERAIAMLQSTVNCPIQASDIRRRFRITNHSPVANEYVKAAWRPTSRVDQTAEVVTMGCEGYTYLVCFLNPMQYSLCIELTPTVTVRDAIMSIMDSCSAQHIKVESIVTSGDISLNATLHQAVATQVAITEMSPGSTLGGLTKRIGMVKLAVRHVISYIDNPSLSDYMKRYLPIAANLQCNRGRTGPTGVRPTESFLNRRMEYRTDVGLQIGSPCIGTSSDGVTRECVYLHPTTACSGEHVTLHLDDGTTHVKRHIVPETREKLLMMMMNGDVNSIAPPSTRLRGLDGYDIETYRTVDDAGYPIANRMDLANESQLRELFTLFQTWQR
jgi:hypothetical protein